MANNHHSAVQGREIVTTRIFDAPRDLVFQVWTQPEHVAQWWGPTGFTITTKEMDVRPGGIWRFTMHGPDGTDYPNIITFKEVKAPELLSYKHADEAVEDPIAFEVRVIFEEENGKTKLTMNHIFASEETLRKVVEEFHAVEGARQTLDRLDAYTSEIFDRGRK